MFKPVKSYYAFTEFLFVFFCLSLFSHKDVDAIQTAKLMIHALKYQIDVRGKVNFLFGMAQYFIDNVHCNRITNLPMIHFLSLKLQ